MTGTDDADLPGGIESPIVTRIDVEGHELFLTVYGGAHHAASSLTGGRYFAQVVLCFFKTGLHLLHLAHHVHHVKHSRQNNLVAW